MALQIWDAPEERLAASAVLQALPGSFALLRMTGMGEFFVLQAAFLYCHSLIGSYLTATVGEFVL
jgi:hypothetical protein